MKEIKLSGRECAVLRAVDSMGSTLEDLMLRTHIDPEQLSDLLSGLAEVGYVEVFHADGTPMMDPFTVEQVHELRFETNPSYTQELKKAMLRY